MIHWIKQLFCRHNYVFLRNVYGDEINLLGGKRSIWICTKCSILTFRRQLVEEVDNAIKRRNS